MSPRPAVPVEHRVFDKFTVSDECWEWTAALNDAGYGQINGGPAHGGRPLRAHRLLYEMLVGRIPPGLDLDHLCRNRACVRPDHVEPVTRGENVRRGRAVDATRARAALQTHCKRGHEFTPENTYMQSLRGGRYKARKCRKCGALRQRRYNAARAN